MTDFDDALAGLNVEPPQDLATATAKLAAALRKLDSGLPGNTQFLRQDGSWSTPPGTEGFTPPDDATAVTKGILQLTNDLAGTADLPEIAPGAVTPDKLSDIAEGSILGRASPGTGSVEELTHVEVTAVLDVFEAGAQGVVPASGGGTDNFLRADGTWATPAGSGGGGSGSNVLTWIGW